MARKKSKGTRKSTLNNKRRKGIGAFVIPWLKRFGVMLGAFALVLWLGAWFFLSGMASDTGSWVKERILVASADAGFRVENILLEGRNNASADIIIAIINMQKGDPIFAFDPYAARQSLEQISWVDAAHVERHLPDTLYIRLNERVPVARLYDGKSLQLVDMYGDIINSDNVSEFDDLFIVKGRGAKSHIVSLMDALVSHPDLQARVKSARLVSERRWDILLKNDVVLKLPQGSLSGPFMRMMKAQMQSQLLEREGVTVIDLRERDRIAVRVKSGEVMDYQASINKKDVGAGDNI